MLKRWLPLGLILVLAALLTPLAQGYTREAIVRPLLYFYWVGRLIFESIPQVVFWSIFLIVILFFAMKSLWQTKPRLRLARQPKAARPEEYYKWRLAQRLNKLVVTALAQDERIEPREVRRRLAGKQLELSPEVQAYLEAGMTSFSHFLGARPRFRLRRQSTALDLDPERIIQFLEENVDYYTE